MRVSVVGANGRVGRALVAHLADRYDVEPITRRPGEDQTGLAARAATNVDVVVNAAGVAHVERPTADDLQRLHTSNVELPVALADACLKAGASLVHISSVKAGKSGGDGPYAASKREGDQALRTGFAGQYERAGSSLIIVRPLALLVAPLDAGRVARLRPLRHVPQVIIPPIKLPVLARDTFLVAVEELVEAVRCGTSEAGLSWRDFDRSERGTLRDVRLAL